MIRVVLDQNLLRILTLASLPLHRLMSSLPSSIVCCFLSFTCENWCLIGYICWGWSEQEVDHLLDKEIFRVTSSMTVFEVYLCRFAPHLFHLTNAKVANQFLHKSDEVSNTFFKLHSRVYNITVPDKNLKTCAKTAAQWFKIAAVVFSCMIVICKTNSQVLQVLRYMHFIKIPDWYFHSNRRGG